jgi:hypothetical protein
METKLMLLSISNFRIRRENECTHWAHTAELQWLRDSESLPFRVYLQAAKRGIVPQIFETSGHYQQRIANAYHPCEHECTAHTKYERIPDIEDVKE